jgi:hypothetical protein
MTSQQWIKVVAPPPVQSPRGAGWAADAVIWLAHACQRALALGFKALSQRRST